MDINILEIQSIFQPLKQMVLEFDYEQYLYDAYTTSNQVAISSVDFGDDIKGYYLKSANIIQYHCQKELYKQIGYIILTDKNTNSKIRIKIYDKQAEYEFNDFPNPFTHIILEFVKRIKSYGDIFDFQNFIYITDNQSHTSEISTFLNDYEAVFLNYSDTNFLNFTLKYTFKESCNLDIGNKSKLYKFYMTEFYNRNNLCFWENYFNEYICPIHNVSHCKSASWVFANKILVAKGSFKTFNYLSDLLSNCTEDDLKDIFSYNEFYKIKTFLWSFIDIKGVNQFTLVQCFILLYFLRLKDMHAIEIFHNHLACGHTYFCYNELFKEELISQICSLENYPILSKIEIDLGHYWENVCCKIAKLNFINDNILFHPSLTNGGIPDITIGLPKTSPTGYVIHVPEIIECKKNTYFLGYSENVPFCCLGSTYKNFSAKYIKYCNKLTFWILDKPATWKSLDYDHVKFVFWEDIQARYKVNDEIIMDVNNIIQITEDVEHSLKQLHKTSLNELYEKYKLIKNYQYTFRHQFTAKKIKPTPTPTTCIRRYSLNGIYISDYSSVEEVIDTENLSRESIMTVIRGTRNSAGGFIWKKVPINSPKDNITSPVIFNLRGKTIIQIDITGEILHKYSTLQEAASAVGIDRKGIRDVINGKQKTAGGFYWSI